jgi:hypothetical protein
MGTPGFANSSRARCAIHSRDTAIRISSVRLFSRKKPFVKIPSSRIPLRIPDPVPNFYVFTASQKKNRTTQTFQLNSKLRAGLRHGLREHSKHDSKHTKISILNLVCMYSKNPVAIVLLTAAVLLTARNIREYFCTKIRFYTPTLSALLGMSGHIWLS